MCIPSGKPDAAFVFPRTLCYTYESCYSFRDQETLLLRPFYTNARNHVVQPARVQYLRTLPLHDVRPFDSERHLKYSEMISSFFSVTIICYYSRGTFFFAALGLSFIPRKRNEIIKEEIITNDLGNVSLFLCILYFL